MKKIAVEIFIPCFVDQVKPETAMNMVKVLEHLGCEVHYNPEQTCCGQPAYNAGFFEESREVAYKFIDDFSKNNRYIVSPSASCVGMVRGSYTSLLEDASQVLSLRQVQKGIYEFTEFLTKVLKVDAVPGASFPHKVTYHDSCSALRELNLKDTPRRLLQNVQGLRLVEMADTESCCGFGGTFAVKYEPISIGMADQKVDNALATEAEYIVSTDTSCLMHLEGYINKQGKNIKVAHIADVLANGI